MTAPARWVPRAAGVVAFAAYALFAAPGMYWLDSQELASSAARLGVPHPTGFPLFAIVAHVASWLPLGELAFRIHLASAACAAVAVWGAARLTLDLLGDDATAVAAAAATAVVLGASFTFFRQATVTEVYAPTVACLAVAVRGAVAVLRGGNGLSLALFAGLAVTGVHASFRLLLAIPFVVLFLWRLRRGARWPIAAPALLVLGAAGIAAYMPLRSATGRVAELDWGHTGHAAGFVDHLTAGRIRRAYAGQMFGGDVAEHAREMGGQLERDLGVLALLAAAGGALHLVTRRGRRGAGALLIVVAAGDFAYAVWVNPMGIAEAQNGTPAALALAVLAGVGVAAAARGFARAAPFAAGALAVIVAVQPVLARGGDRFGAAASDAPRAYAEAALDRSPVRAEILVRSDNLAGTLFWLTLVEGARPDVAVLARQHLWDTARTDAVLRGDRDRPRVWEPGDDAMPAGLSLDMPVASTVPADHRRSIAELERIFAAPATGDENAAIVAARAYVNLGVLAASRGDHAAAAEVTERAIPLTAEALTCVNAARYRLALGDDAAARAHAVEAIERDPQRADAWALVGVVEARAGHCAAARTALDRALRLDPAEPDALANRARLDDGCRE